MGQAGVAERHEPVYMNPKVKARQIFPYPNLMNASERAVIMFLIRRLAPLR
jgi:hypothetical protein